MKKTFSILILICLIINISGSWLLYNVYLHAAKEDIKCFIQSNPNDFNFVQFKITPQNTNDYRIQDEGNEVVYDGVLYDKVTKKENGDTIVLSCLKDLNETNIVAAYYRYIEKQHKQSSNSKSTEPHHFSNQIYDDFGFSVSLNHPNCFVLGTWLSFGKVRFDNVSAEVITPPPQLKGFN